GSAFTSCPQYTVGDTGVAGTSNVCTYLYGGHWKTISEGSPSPHGDTCLNYAVCGRSHGKVVVDVDEASASRQDEYYLMCTQCAEGYVPASLNSNGQWVEAFDGSSNPNLCANQGDNPQAGCLKTFRDQGCQDDTNPVYCYKKTDLSFCPDPFVGDDDSSLASVSQECKYFSNGDWVKRGSGERSPFPGEECDTYSICGFEQEKTLGIKKDTYRVVCDSCKPGHAGGLTSTTLNWSELKSPIADPPLVDDAGMLGVCNVESTPYPSMCYNKNSSFTSCPSLPVADSADSESVIDKLFPDGLKSQDCEYRHNNRWVDVDPGESSPFDAGSCSQFEMCDVSEDDMKTSFKIACKNCAYGFYPSAPVFSDKVNYLGSCKQEFYPTICYQHETMNTNWMSCPTSGYQDVKCKYWKTPGYGKVVDNGAAPRTEKPVWESKSEGQLSPYYYDSIDTATESNKEHVCSEYKMCHSKIDDPNDPEYMDKDEYYLVCTQCAGGYYPTVIATANDKPGAEYGNCAASDQLIITECSRIPTSKPTPAPTSSFILPPDYTDDEIDEEEIIDDKDDKDTGGGGEENDFSRPEGLTDKLREVVGDNTPLVVGGFIALCIGCGFCALKGGCSCGGGGGGRYDDEDDYDYEYDSDTDDSSRYSGEDSSRYTGSSKYSRDSSGDVSTDSSRESSNFDYENPMRGAKEHGKGDMKVGRGGLLEMT
ncbi:hypothetical protein TrRE_jg1400, partial [Triparma retinervis]